MKHDAVTREEVWVLAALWFVSLVTAAWWALALWPTGPATPEWLTRTQAVCFGVRASGLPDAAGWTGLIGSPLGMYGLLFVSGRSAFLRLAERLRAARLVQASVALLVVFVTVSAAAAVLRVRSLYAQPGEELLTTELGSAVRTDRPAPSLRLVDQFGRRRDLREFKGRSVIVTFAYAHCETVCPVLVRNALSAQKQLRGRARTAPIVLIVTLDPARDTPARLPTIAQQWELGADAYVLSGPAGDVEDVLDEWQIARTTDATDGSVTHAAIINIIKPDGRVGYEVVGAAPELIVKLLASL